MGIAKQGKVVDLAWMPLPGSTGLASGSTSGGTGAAVLAVAGEDGQLSFLEASHPSSGSKTRAHAFRHLPGSGRPLPLVRVSVLGIFEGFSDILNVFTTDDVECSPSGQTSSSQLSTVDASNPACAFQCWAPVIWHLVAAAGNHP